MYNLGKKPTGLSTEVKYIVQNIPLVDPKRIRQWLG